MNEITAAPELAQPRAVPLLKYLLQALILLPVVAGFVIYRVWIAQPATVPAATQAATTTISAKTLEERFGVRITLIAVTAAGGVVDFRYKILDQEKARFLFGDAHTMPTLLAEESGISLEPPRSEAKHNSRLENGSSHFQFYANTRNALKPGARVTVLFGSLRLEPIIVQ